MEFISLYIPMEKSIDEVVAILKEASDYNVSKSDGVGESPSRGS